MHCPPLLCGPPRDNDSGDAFTNRSCADPHAAKRSLPNFFRNRPELELLCRLLQGRQYGSRVDIAVVACSKGAEVYSVSWAVRSARPDLDLHIHGIDIDAEVVEFAKEGVYSVLNCDIRFDSDQSRGDAARRVMAKTFEDQPSSPFERLTADEFEGMFEVSGNYARIRSTLKHAIIWHTVNANSRKLVELIGPQDIVFGNRFLCHMEPEYAERCLLNLMSLVKPGGVLFVSGIDLDVRTRVVRKAGWQPITDLIREVHEGDPSVMKGWPLEYWGVDPFDRSRPDWDVRYASGFRNPSGDRDRTSMSRSPAIPLGQMDSGPRLECRECGQSTFLRRSRFRVTDIVWLVLLQRPIRCRWCGKRQHISVLSALRAQIL